MSDSCREVTARVGAVTFRDRPGEISNNEKAQLASKGQDIPQGQGQAKSAAGAAALCRPEKASRVPTKETLGGRRRWCVRGQRLPNLSLEKHVWGPLPQRVQQGQGMTRLRGRGLCGLG